MKRKCLALVLALMSLVPLLVIGHSHAQQPKQELVYNAFGDTAYYDPRNANGADHRMLLTQTFEPLILKTGEGAFKPGAAESWEVSEDGTVYTFHLREKMYWSDGKPVTAADYVYSYRTGVSPEFASVSANSYEFLENAAKIIAGEMEVEELGVEAIDDYTLKCTLSKANPFAESLFSSVNLAAVPMHVANEDSSDWSLYPETAIGNGPFMMTEWLPKEKITLVPNPHYYNQERVKLDKLTFVFVADINTAINAFRNRDIDVMTQVPATEVEKMQEAGELTITPRVGTYYYAINMNGLNNVDPDVWSALSKVEVRKALNLAIDRNQLVKIVTRTGETPAYGFVPEGVISQTGEDF